MKTCIKHFYTALAGLAILSSCSRPVAYFQRGPVERYNTSKVETTSEKTVSEAAPAPDSQPTVVASPVTPSTQPVVQAQTAMNQINAYVRNDNKLASNKKLTRRMDRVKAMLSSISAKPSAAQETTTSTKKMHLLERIAAKHIDKKIKNKLSPDHTTATSRLTIGLIVAAAGLLLLLIGNGFGAVIGGIALVVGIVLIILELINQ